jgi:hypothetical protein
VAQPDYVPIPDSERVRPILHLEDPRHWVPDRPGELAFGALHPEGPSYGQPGPDQGYALRLLEQVKSSIVVAEAEDPDDIYWGLAAVAQRRAVKFGRAPLIYDIQWAIKLFGFDHEADQALVELRRELFSGAAHDYWSRRRAAGWVPEELLRLPPAEARPELLLAALGAAQSEEGRAA